MYSHAPAEYRCPFCQVAAGHKEPTLRTRQADIVRRRTRAMAFAAADWRHNNSGHVLVIPTQHDENIYALPLDVGADLQAVVKDVSLAMKRV